MIYKYGISVKFRKVFLERENDIIRNEKLLQQIQLLGV